MTTPAERDRDPRHAVEEVRTDPAVELSIVLPCLDEIETIGTCLDKATRSATALGLTFELVVADNGSTDGSQQTARERGARVIDVATRGYGAALAAGIDAARGRYVVMADADDSYALDELGPFVDRLRDGADLVMGDRFGGGIDPGAMPWLHRRVGNPVLSFLGRRLFRTDVRDFHCGMRGLRRSAIRDLDLRTTGMEYASEMVVRSALDGLRIDQVPTTLSPDGRSRSPHLRTWRDGWRHLRFLLLFSPRWLFLVPGTVLVVIGLVGMLALLPGPVRIGGIELDIHALLYAHLALVVGLQAIFLAVFVRIYATFAGLLPPRGASVLDRVRLEHLLAGGLVLVLAGTIGSVVAVARWGSESFAGLDPSETMRIVIPSVTAVAMGAEVVLTSFVVGVLSLPRR